MPLKQGMEMQKHSYSNQNDWRLFHVKGKFTSEIHVLNICRMIETKTYLTNLLHNSRYSLSAHVERDGNWGNTVGDHYYPGLWFQREKTAHIRMCTNFSVFSCLNNQKNRVNRAVKIPCLGGNDYFHSLYILMSHHTRMIHSRWEYLRCVGYNQKDLTRAYRTKTSLSQSRTSLLKQDSRMKRFQLSGNSDKFNNDNIESYNAKGKFQIWSRCLSILAHDSQLYYSKDIYLIVRK